MAPREYPFQQAIIVNQIDGSGPDEKFDLARHDSEFESRVGREVAMIAHGLTAEAAAVGTRIRFAQVERLAAFPIHVVAVVVDAVCDISALWPLSISSWFKTPWSCPGTRIS